jgi:hypothetical protein
MAFRARSQWRDIGLAVRVLQDKLASLPRFSLSRFITVPGWQEARSSFHPIIIELERKANDREVRVRHAPRWLPKGQWGLQELGGYLSDQDLTALFERLRLAYRSTLPNMRLDALEAVLADCIRNVSRLNAGVGSDLLIVIIPFPKLARPRVKFLPEHEHRITLSNFAHTETLAAEYTPWLIGPSILHPPALNVGGSTVVLNGVAVDIVGSTPTGHIKAVTSSYKRVGPPM